LTLLLFFACSRSLATLDLSNNILDPLFVKPSETPGQLLQAPPPSLASAKPASLDSPMVTSSSCEDKPQLAVQQMKGREKERLQTEMLNVFAKVGNT
jgi:hypothetical protein